MSEERLYQQRIENLNHRISVAEKSGVPKRMKHNWITRLKREREAVDRSYGGRFAVG